MAEAGGAAGGELARGAEALAEARPSARPLWERLQQALLSSSPREAFGVGAGAEPPIPALVVPGTAHGEVGAGVGDPLGSSSRACGQECKAAAASAADGGGELAIGGGGGMAGGASCALVQECGGVTVTVATPQRTANAGRGSRGPRAAAHDAKAILLGSRREVQKLRRQRQKQQQQQGEEKGQGDERRSHTRRCSSGRQPEHLRVCSSSSDSDTNAYGKPQRLAGHRATPGEAPPGSRSRRNPSNDAPPAKRLRAAGRGGLCMPCTTAVDPEIAAACGGAGEGTGAACRAERQHRQPLTEEPPQVAAGDATGSGSGGKDCDVPGGTGSAVAAGAGRGSPVSGEADPRVCVPGWVPPASPWGLLEEALYDSPWRLLVACVLLNRTTGRQVRLGAGTGDGEVSYG